MTRRLHLQFEKWLTEQRNAGVYTESTCAQSARDMSRVFNLHANKKPVATWPRYLRHAIRRFQVFVAEANVSEEQLPPGLMLTLLAFLQVKHTREVDAAILGKVGRRSEPRRKSKTVSVPDEQWQKLYIRVHGQDRHTDRVLEVMMNTGLRISDVLRTKYNDLRKGIETSTLALTLKGGKEWLWRVQENDCWHRLFRAWVTWRDTSVDYDGNIAHFVTLGQSHSTLGQSTPYKVVAARLKEHAKNLGIEERVHLHRLRRTVGVQALRVTKDVVAVQQLLAHNSIKTTFGYIDEARPDDVAEVQKAVAERFLKKL